MSDQTTPEAAEWTLSRGWKASLTEGCKAVFICGLGTSIATLMSGLLPLTIPFMVPTIAIGTMGITICHAYFANKYMLRPVYRRLDPSRRLFIRWGSRIAFANLIVMIYSPATLFSGIVSPAAFAAFITVQKRVLDIQLHRQESGLPLTVFERCAIGLLLCISMVVFGGLILAAALLGFSVEWLLDYFQLLPDANTSIPAKP